MTFFKSTLYILIVILIVMFIANGFVLYIQLSTRVQTFDEVNENHDNMDNPLTIKVGLKYM